jgi:hypothetical protein
MSLADDESCAIFRDASAADEGRRPEKEKDVWPNPK